MGIEYVLTLIKQNIFFHIEFGDDILLKQFITLLRFSGVFSDPVGRKSFLILLSVGYFCQITYIFIVEQSVSVCGLKRPQKTSNANIYTIQHPNALANIEGTGTLMTRLQYY